MVLRLIVWYFTLLILGWITFPISFRIFAKLPDRGYALSRVLGLLLWGFGFWLLASLGVLQNSSGGILLVLTAVIGISVWCGWRHKQILLAWISEHWRLILMTEVLFWISFTFLALVRASNPDATGTEKPMELAFINAILNSDTFPPNDPWLSGYAISYYHFGYILAGMLAKVTGTPGVEAFNLMLTSTFAMSAVGAYGVVYDLLTAFAGKVRQTISDLFWALLGPLFLLFISNLEAILEMLHQAGVGWHLESGTSRFWAWVNIESLTQPPSGPLTLIPQRFWWWWQASRVVQDIDLLGNVSPLSPIDEFPAFSFVLGDLHPHVLVIPFAMLAVGLALTVFLGGLDRKISIWGIEVPFRWDLFGVLAITLGGIAFLNTWDLPVYFTLVVGAFLFSQVRVKGWDWDRLYELVIFAVPLGALSLLLYAPFLLSLQSQAGGILPNLIYPTRGLYLWIMFGTLFVPIFLLFGWLARRRTSADWRRGTVLVLFLVLSLIFLSVLLGFFAARTQIGQQVIASQGKTTFGEVLEAAVPHRLKFGFSLLTLAGLLIIGLSYLLGTGQTAANTNETNYPFPFVLLMIVLGGVMVLAPEFVYLADVFGTRMNTVFKFYYQAWMLWSLASAFAAVMIFKHGRWVSKMVVLVFVLLGLAYPVLAYPDKTNGFQSPWGFTLDAGDYMTRQAPDDAAAIAWLRAAESGIVAEAVGGQYSGYARVATLSGQPTVLGWPGHEGQWRGGYEEVGSREQDIRTLYETADWETALEIIQRYNIRFIFLGDLEMRTYAVNTQKFEINLGLGFEQGNTRVFVVPPVFLD